MRIGSWSSAQFGHGDLHELGHGLERDRFRLDGWPCHTTTNFYSYYAKSRYHRLTGGDPVCQSLPFEDVYGAHVASLDEPDPAAYLASMLWASDHWSEGAAMYVQMMMAVEDQGALSDGWYLLAQLHLIERENQKAVRSDTLWSTKRDGTGTDAAQLLHQLRQWLLRW